MPDEVVYPKFQSTLLQEERPSSLSLYLSYCLISIHAPTRGATCNRDISVFIFIISIHAPTRGATSRKPNGTEVRNISIHAPTRGATIGERDRLNYLFISIHAPTRGATVLSSVLPPSSSYFNPRSYKRSDLPFLV